MSTNPRTSARLDFIDVHRGLAVALMLWMHTADGWLRPELKRDAAWGWVRSVGGFAAPTFMLLAGLSLSLGWTAPSRPNERRAELTRALQIMVLGYALRLQMWMLDAGGCRHLKGWLVAGLLAFAYVAGYRALAAFGRAEPDAGRVGRAALIGFVSGLALVAMWFPGRSNSLLRVDVLQGIGASLVCLAALREPLRERPSLGIALAALTASLTSWMRSWVPGPLPSSIAGYLATWDAAPGEFAPTLFPLFPWLAYVLVGASVGLDLGRAEHRDGTAARRALLLAVLGAGVAVVSCEALRPVHMLLLSWPGLTQPARVAYRVGVALVLGGMAVGLSRSRVPFRATLISLGRASLFIYWIHLEFAFGSLSRPLARKLDFEEWALGWLAMLASVAALAPLWLRLRARLRSAKGRRFSVDDQRAEPATISGT